MVARQIGDLQLRCRLFFVFFPASPDYPLDLNHNETFLQATTFLPEDFTYFPNHTCPERLPSMSEYSVRPAALCPLPIVAQHTMALCSTLVQLFPTSPTLFQG